MLAVKMDDQTQLRQINASHRQKSGDDQRSFENEYLLFAEDVRYFIIRDSTLNSSP